MKDPGDVVALILSAIPTVLIEVFAVEPMAKAMFIDTPLGISNELAYLFYIIILIGSFVGMIGVFAGIVKKLTE
jgi:hypothetical protein